MQWRSFPANRAVTTVEPAIAKPFVDMDVLAQLHPELMNDAYLYLHCHFENHWQDLLIRIWKTTFVIDRGSPARSQLVHAENITIAPLWTLVPDNQPFSFLLIFPSLPKSCTLFDMVEEISSPGGFVVRNIKRNESDVYHVELT